MSRCIRDVNGRFAKHEPDMSFLEAVSKDAEFVICKRCGRKTIITGLMKLCAKQQKIDILPIMKESNEILEDAEFIEAVGV